MIDDHELHHWESEGGCVAHPNGERADVGLAAASQPEDTAESALEAFARLANWSLLHPADLERFEQFMTLAHRAGWLATTVEARLLALGLPAELCGQLRRRYWNRTRPLPMGVGRRELDEQIKTLNAKLTRHNATHQE